MYIFNSCSLALHTHTVALSLNTTSQLIKNASPSDSTQQMLQCVTAERDRLQKEKEEEVATLNGKLHAMEKSYEAVLQVCVVCGNWRYCSAFIQAYFHLKAHGRQTLYSLLCVEVVLKTRLRQPWSFSPIELQ